MAYRVETSHQQGWGERSLRAPGAGRHRRDAAGGRRGGRDGDGHVARPRPSGEESHRRRRRLTVAARMGSGPESGEVGGCGGGGGHSAAEGFFGVVRVPRRRNEVKRRVGTWHCVQGLAWLNLWAGPEWSVVLPACSLRPLHIGVRGCLFSSLGGMTCRPMVPGEPPNFLISKLFINNKNRMNQRILYYYKIQQQK